MRDLDHGETTGERGDTERLHKNYMFLEGTVQQGPRLSLFRDLAVTLGFGSVPFTA